MSEIEQNTEPAAETELTSSDTDSLSHAELIEYFQECMRTLITIDPILKDIRPDVTLQEVEALLALENGQAMTVFVDRADGPPWKIVVAREALVHDLKVALKHHVALNLRRRRVFKKISWKYIWRTYWLCFEGDKLVHDYKKLQTYGIRNNSQLTFVKKIRQKGC